MGLIVLFGLYAPIEAMIKETPPTDGPDAWARFAREAVVAADQAGFSITLVAQRLLGPNLEAFVQSAALAAVTQRIRIMAAVHPIFWTPQVAAKMCASIDILSGGRFDFNLVTGWYDDEARRFGGAELGGTQYARSEEFVAICRRLWAGETLTFHGEYYDVDEASLHLTPIGQPEIYTTTRSSEQSLTMAARLGDWWFTSYKDDFRNADENIRGIRPSIEAMIERAGRFGRRMRYAVPAFLIHDEDERAAIRRAEEVERFGHFGGRDADDQHNRLNRSRGLGIGLIGSRNRILDRLCRLQEVGVEMVLLRMQPTLPTIHYLGEHVIPEAARLRTAAEPTGAS
jgi:FMNH2-dependent dimethyl sulfone monooxygenase